MATTRELFPLLLLGLAACAVEPADDVAEASSAALETWRPDALTGFGARELVWIESRMAHRPCVGTGSGLLGGVYTNAGLRGCGEDADVHYTVERGENGYVSFRNDDNGRCLDVSWASLDDGAEVIEWACHGGASQRWRSVELTPGVFRLVNAQSSKCLDVDLRDPQRKRLHQWTCHDGDNQRWRVHRATTHRLALPWAASGSWKCVDVYGASPADGAAVKQWDCGDQDNQAFWLLKHGDAHEIRAVHSGKCLAFQGAGDWNGTALVQTACDGGAAQRFRFENGGAVYGAKQIRASYVPKCLDRWSGYTSQNGEGLQLWACHGGANQSFHLWPRTY